MVKIYQENFKQLKKNITDLQHQSETVQELLYIL
jgi:hypothetical protein